MRDVYSCIDLGTNSIKIVVCEKVNDNFNVLASVSSPSKGIKDGFIIDSKASVNSIKVALKKIDDMLGVRVSKVVACIPSSQCKMDIVVGSCSVIDYNEITGSDVSNCLLDAIKGMDFSSDELVSCMPIHFTIDDNKSVSDPKGMKGSTLDTRVVVSTTPKEPLYRILEVLKLAGLETVDVCFSSVGDYFAIKDRKYDDLVGAIINIGEESTNVSVFNKGIQIKNSLLPVGSSNVSKDISYVFKTSLEEANNIKEKFSMALASYADSNELYKANMEDGTVKELNQLGVSKVVEARIREILKLTKNEIKNLTNREIRYIIVTGGLTELAGFSNVVEQEFGFVAKVCNITTMGVRHNKFSSSYGTIKYFDDKLKLRGKHYNMFSKDEIDAIVSVDSSVTNENMLSKVFGHFFEH
ncbi:MAG: cell division protein FtsA [Bacilli bacterium]|nr:cell division protein FtsA [Bacilli bacterium]MBR2997679.1 cell division protein FtsA [Bacilli bacterium]